MNGNEVRARRRERARGQAEENARDAAQRRASISRVDEDSAARQARGGGTGTASVRVRPASLTRPGQANSGAVSTTGGVA